METTITLSHPNGGEIVYHIRLDKRYGMHTRESYDAEIARIIAMGTDAGSTVTVESNH